MNFNSDSISPEHIAIGVAGAIGLGLVLGWALSRTEEQERVDNAAQEALQELVIEQPLELVTTKYSKLDNASEKLAKQLRFAKEEQTKQAPKGFVWEKSVNTDYSVEIENFVELSAGASCAQGKRSSMEDEHLAKPVNFIRGTKAFSGKFYGVFDGHGGSEVSGFLKEKIIEKLEQELSSSETSEPNDEVITNALTRVFLSLDLEAREKFASGSTATCALVFNGKIYVPNVGDSRTITVRKDETIQLSEDANPLNRRFFKQINAAFPRQQIRQYIYTEHSDGGQKVIRAIDDISRKNEVLLPEKGQKTVGRITVGKPTVYSPSTAIARTIGDSHFNLSAKPKITSIQMADSEVLVLACDGLWDVASTDEVGRAVREMVSQGLNETEISSELTKAALIHGSSDNVSVMVVKAK